jgi:hypothetical protein
MLSIIYNSGQWIKSRTPVILSLTVVQEPKFPDFIMFLLLFSDLVILTTDVPTLFGVATGLAIFTALICFVLKLFSRARYSRPRHYANANLAPPILFSSETG